MESLDLSCVRLILNGGEPISVGLCQRFSAEMASHGLSESAMYPVYGLAEASVSVTLPEPGAKLISVSIDRNANALGEAVKLLTPDDPAAVSFPCVGRAIKGCEVRITDEAGSPLAAQTVGHIEIRGDNVTKGYYVNPEADRAVQREQGWLDTGDLGFVTDSGLVVTGRFKEIIFCLTSHLLAKSSLRRHLLTKSSLRCKAKSTLRRLFQQRFFNCNFFCDFS